MAVVEQARDRARSAWSAARWPGRALVAGPLGSLALLLFYLGIISWAQGWDHALSQLQQDLWFIAPITVGFGTQVGLFVYLRRLQAVGGAGVVTTAGSTGVSTGAMLACCAHHLADVLPIVGVSGAAIFLNDMKTPIAALGIVLNAAGITYMLISVRRLRLRTCLPGALAGTLAESKGAEP